MTRPSAVIAQGILTKRAQRVSPKIRENMIPVRFGCERSGRFKKLLPCIAPRPGKKAGLRNKTLGRELRRLLCDI